MSSPKCDELKAEVEALRNWTQSLGESTQCHPNYNANEESKKCEVEISGCIPGHVKLFHENKPKFRGPNCWNLSLTMSKIIPSMRYSQPKEMSFYMRAPLCRGLKNGEAREAGDIGVIRRVNDRKLLRPASFAEIHGFIYVSSKLAYSKNGMGEFIPFLLQDLDTVINKYKVPQRSECRNNELNTDSKCGISLAYYRCDEMNKYLDGHKDIPKEVLSEFRVIEGFEGFLEKQTMKDRSFPKDSQNNLIKSIKNLTKFVNDESDEDMSLGMSDEEKNFILGSIQMRLDAMLGQLNYNGQTRFEANLKSLVEEMDEAFLKAGVKKFRNN